MKIFNVPMRAPSFIEEVAQLLDKGKRKQYVFCQEYLLQTSLRYRLSKLSKNNVEVLLISTSKIQSVVNTFNSLGLALPGSINNIVSDTELFFLVKSILAEVSLTVSTKEHDEITKSLCTIADESKFSDSRLLQVKQKFIEYLNENDLTFKEQYLAECFKRLLKHVNARADADFYFLLPALDEALMSQLTTELARLPNLYFILQGADYSLPQALIEALPKEHPQYHIYSFLSKLSYIKDEVIRLGQDTDYYKEIMHPAEFVYTWYNQNLGDVEFVEAATFTQETRAVAAISADSYRQGKSTAIIANDKAFITQLCYELKSLGIEIVGEQGVDATYSLEGDLLLLLIDILDKSTFQPEMLIRLLQSQLLAGNESIREEAEKLVQVTANVMVRYNDYQAYIAYLLGIEEFPTLAKLKTFLKRLSEKMSSTSSSFIEIFKLEIDLIREVFNINTPILETIAESISLNTSYSHDGIMGYRESLKQFLKLTAIEQGEVLEAVDSKLVICSMQEARILSTEVAIITNAVEGSLPNLDCYYSKYPIYKELGQKNIGKLAWEFLCLINTKKVYISFSNKVAGEDVSKSRWLELLQAYFNVNQKEIPIKSASKLLIAPVDKYGKLKEMSMSDVPVSARPKKLSGTALELLINNPYLFYLKYILNLKPLNESPLQLTRKNFGILIHKFLATLGEKYGDEPNAFLDKFEPLYKELTQGIIGYPEVRRSWYYKFYNIISALAKEAVVPNRYHETYGYLKLDIMGHDIVLYAIADRLDQHQDNSLTIVDYKSGMAPSQNAVSDGASPQLAIEALIAKKGGYKVITNKIREIQGKFIELKGSVDKPIVVKNIKLDIEQIEEGISKLLADYLSPEYKFIASKAENKYQDYTHILREQERL